MQQRRIRSFILYTLAAAGGHAALLYASSWQRAWLQEHLDNPGEALRPAVCVAGWGFFALRVLLPATLPFWLGLLIAAVLRPVTLLFSRLLRLKRRRAAVFVTALFYTLLGLLLWLLLTLLWGQFCSIAARLPQLYKTVFLPALADFFEWLSALLARFAPDLSGAVQLWMQSFASAAAKLSTSASSALLAACTDIAGKIPLWFLTVVVTIFCSGFISLDYPKVMQLLLLPIPQKLRPGLARLKNFAATTLLRLVRAYLLLLLITFGELCLGLWLLGVGPFAAVAAVIALLDLLPVIGTGSVLVPWAVLALLGGESGLGWGLIVLYLVITVARNFLEPRIVGSSIGLPPLLSLVCVYAGLRLFGVLGAVLMPCAALTVLFFLKSNRASPPAEKPE